MLNTVSLREQVYYFLREKMHKGHLLPGSNIDLNRIALDLGISKTPLRDALIRLEAEGYVEILPRRGIRVALLRMEDVRNIYQFIGYLESGIIQDHFMHITADHVKKMHALNEKMKRSVLEGDFDSYYNLNLDFHGVYVELSDNEEIKYRLTTMKQRLYDFPRRCYIQDWELRNCDEHDQFLSAVKNGQAAESAAIMRDIHWSYKVQEPSIRRFYAEVAKQIEAETTARAS